MDNKDIFAENLNYYMKLKEKSRRDVCEALGFSYYTFTDWVKGKKYPRMDKVEMLADYFGILKSDLIEKRTTEHRQTQKNNDTISSIVVRMRIDSEFFSLIEGLNRLTPVQLASIKQVVDAFPKN